MAEQFVSEPMQPVKDTFETSAMARGEPGLPHQFLWREQSHQVEEVLQTWITSTPECSGGEVYLRRHWWKLRTTGHLVLTIYCERQARSRAAARRRWFVFSVGT